MSQNVERFGVEAVWIDARFEPGVKEYNITIRRTDQNTRRSTRSMSKAFDQFDKSATSSLADVKAGMDIFLGVMRTTGRVAGRAFQAAAEGAQQLAQERSFAIASGGAEQAAKNLQAMREATRGTATDAQLMEQALGILATGLATNEEELFAVTRNVTTLAATFKGLGAERALLSFQLLATDLEASKARLDDFGLTMADVKDRIEEFTDAGMDMQEATRAALLAEMSDVMEDLGLNAATTADSFGQARTTAGNLANEFKQALAPGMSLVADAFVTAVTNTEDLDEAWNKLSLTGVKVGAAIAAIGEGIRQQVTLEFQEGMGAGQSYEQFLFGLGEETDKITAVQDVYNNALQAGIDRMNEADSVADQLGDGIGETGDEAGEASEEWKKFNQTISQLETRGLEQLLDRAIAAERQLEDAALARARKIEEIERQTADRRAQIAAQGAQRRQQIEQSFLQTLESLQSQAAEARRQRETQLNRQLEEIDRRFKERRRQINQQFAVSFKRAVRSRDALALVEAVRTRERELAEARNQRNQERSEAQQNFQQQEQEQQRSLQRQIEEARRAREQQILDLQASLAQQEQNLRDSADKQLEDFDRSQERKRQDQERAAQRQLADQLRQFRQQQIQAQAVYQQNESLYRNHLERMLALTNAFIPAIFGGTQDQGRPSTTGTSGVPRRRAEGGIDIVNTPTQFLAGEAGPEVVITQPLSQVALPAQTSATVGGSVRHDVSGAISAQMAGFEGRLTAEINNAVMRAFREVLR